QAEEETPCVATNTISGRSRYIRVAESIMAVQRPIRLVRTLRFFVSSHARRPASAHSVCKIGHPLFREHPSGASIFNRVEAPLGGTNLASSSPGGARFLFPSLDPLLQPLRSPVRLRHNPPGSTKTAIMTLALAIGANALVF